MNLINNTNRKKKTEDRTCDVRAIVTKQSSENTNTLQMLSLITKSSLANWPFLLEDECKSSIS